MRRSERPASFAIYDFDFIFAHFTLNATCRAVSEFFVGPYQCTRTAAKRFSSDAPGSLGTGFAASARLQRRSFDLRR
jgi:hypothetical protein